MDYLVDTLTRAPSQVLVKSATQFGEEAAKVVGAHIEETLKSVSDDVNTTIRETASDVSSRLAATVSSFQDTFKETGVEAFTEWGIAIERAFLHLGQKFETGLSNAGNRFANAVRDSVDEGCAQIGSGVEAGFNRAIHSIDNFGLAHAAHYKQVYSREISVLLIGVIVIAASALMYSMAYLISVLIGGDNSGTVVAIGSGDMNGTYAAIASTKLLTFTQLINIITFVSFSALNGYIIYAWNKSASASVAGAATTESSTGPGMAGEEDQSLATDHRILSTTRHREGQIIDNPKVLFVVVGVSGFVAGQIIRNLSQMTSFRDIGNILNMFISVAIMVLLTLFMYKMFTFDVFYRLYALKMDISEFLEWKRRQSSKRDHDDSSDTDSDTSTDTIASYGGSNSRRKKKKRTKKRKVPVL